MSSVPAAPIRQPRGPTTAGFGRPASPVDGSSAPGSANVNAQSGPPAADTDSTLRRNRTVGSGQSGRYGHATSASLGGAALGYSAAGAGGARTGTGGGSNASTDGGPKYKESRFRSGSLSSQHSASSDGQSGVIRRTSTRERPESRSGVQEVVHEDKDLESPVGGLEGGWGKGLARQSSLPSRRGEFPLVLWVRQSLTHTQCLMHGTHRLMYSSQRVHVFNPAGTHHDRTAPSSSAHIGSDRCQIRRTSFHSVACSLAHPLARLNRLSNPPGRCPGQHASPSRPVRCTGRSGRRSQSDAEPAQSGP